MKPMRRCKVVLSRLRRSGKDYCTETSLHGFRHITDSKSSKFKSYFWATICVISTCLCFILIRSQFRSYYSNRITTTISTTAFPIWEVPFPAVTICNFNVVYKANIQEFKELLEKEATPTAIDNFFTNLSSLVLSSKIEKDIKWTDHYPIARLLERAGYNTEKLMETLVHPCDQMITDCFWNNQEENCSDIFQLVKTTSGFCCSFNYRGKKIDEEELYVSGVGPSFGLYAHLNAEDDEYFSPLKHSVGFDISVHENIQYPDMTLYSTNIRPGTDVSLSIKPEITQSEDAVRGMEIRTRGCAFPEEVLMSWTSRYSYTTCINKCKAMLINRLCRCIPYYYYPVKGAYRYCTLSDMTCITKNNLIFKNSKLSYSGMRSGQTGLYKYSGDALKCTCYPQCNDISYSYQHDQQPLKMSDTEPRLNDSVLRVYFGHVTCTKLQRNVLITWELILASVGGLIGLCLGGSILSIIEFFYHILETLFSRYGKQKKFVKPEKTKYKPKLYLSDFGYRPKKTVFQISKTNEFSEKVTKLKL